MTFGAYQQLRLYGYCLWFSSARLQSHEALTWPHTVLCCPLRGGVSIYSLHHTCPLVPVHNPLLSVQNAPPCLLEQACPCMAASAVFCGCNQQVLSHLYTNLAVLVPPFSCLLEQQVSSYDDVGGEVADVAREAALSAMASAHVIVLVLDVAIALKSQKVSAAPRNDPNQLQYDALN